MVDGDDDHGAMFARPCVDGVTNTRDGYPVDLAGWRCAVGEADDGT
jgi:hypothetical protein